MSESKYSPIYLKTPGAEVIVEDSVQISSNTANLFDCYNDIDIHYNSILNQSDARYKTNIAPTEVNALELLSKIDLKQFDWIESGEHNDIGIIAQQLREIAPELVDENKKTGRLSIKTDKFVPYLVKAVQELADIVKKSGAPTTVAKVLSVNDAGKWTDTYTDEEKRAFIGQNHPVKLGPKREPDPPRIIVKK